MKTYLITIKEKRTQTQTRQIIAKNKKEAEKQASKDYQIGIFNLNESDDITLYVSGRLLI